jgi:RNA polymerase sigma-70 factor (ECF subfamily)
MSLPENDPRLARLRAGDAEALSSLLAELTPVLVRRIEQRLDPAQRQRFEPLDIVQDALLEATQRFPEWCAQDSYPFQVWLRLLAAQALARALRRHHGAQMRSAAREQAFEADVGSGASSFAARSARQLMASQTSPTQAARRSELRERVLAALEELDELDREVLAMRTFEQLTNDEVASELGLDKSASSKRFTRALQRIRPALRAFEPSEIFALQ